MNYHFDSRLVLLGEDCTIKINFKAIRRWSLPGNMSSGWMKMLRWMYSNEFLKLIRGKLSELINVASWLNQTNLVSLIPNRPGGYCK